MVPINIVLQLEKRLVVCSKVLLVVIWPAIFDLNLI